MTDPTIVGVSGHFHDSACCVIRNHALAAAVQEERLSRIKHDRATPVRAFRACLSRAGLDVTDVDCVAYYERATPRFDPVDRLRNAFGYEGRIRCFGHHHSHAASTFSFSGFERAAVLTVDGAGEGITTAYWYGDPDGLTLLETVPYPHSLGLFYSAFTAYLGFAVNDGEGKVMGLAPYGKPVFLHLLGPLLSSDAGSQFRLDMRYFDFDSAVRMHSTELEALLGRPARRNDEPLEAFHADVARSVQAALENALLAKIRYLHERTRSSRLCLAGAVALNCVANGRIAREGPFEEIFVQPAAGDAGGALGAAALAHAELCPGAALLPLRSVFLGPTYDEHAIRTLLDSTPVHYRHFADDGGLASSTAAHLAAGRTVGWFQDGMEFGQRALGARSILADPRVAGMRDRINDVVKRREAFRPFAPAVLHEHAASCFAMTHESPFMLLTCSVLPTAALPAVTHVDGSARVQTVRLTERHPLTRVLEAFDRFTGCPALLNTSFNVRDEPIVCTPDEALACFLRSDLDVLVLGTFMIERAAVSPLLIDVVRRAHVPQPPAIAEHVYAVS